MSEIKCDNFLQNGYVVYSIGIGSEEKRIIFGDWTFQGIEKSFKEIMKNIEKIGEITTVGKSQINVLMEVLNALPGMTTGEVDDEDVIATIRIDVDYPRDEIDGATVPGRNAIIVVSFSLYLYSDDFNKKEETAMCLGSAIGIYHHVNVLLNSLNDPED